MMIVLFITVLVVYPRLPFRILHRRRGQSWIPSWRFTEETKWFWHTPWETVISTPYEHLFSIMPPDPTLHIHHKITWLHWKKGDMNMSFTKQYDYMLPRYNDDHDNEIRITMKHYEWIQRSAFIQGSPKKPIHHGTHRSLGFSNVSNQPKETPGVMKWATTFLFTCPRWAWVFLQL